MARKRFTPKIPKKPMFKRQSYMVPDNYSKVYEQAGITDPDEQAMLFHVTQWGGFRCRKLPKYMQDKEKFMDKWFRHEKDFGYFHFKANQRFLSKFGNVEIKPLKKIWRNGVLKEDEMTEFGFSEEDINDSYKFLHALNDFYSTLRVGIPIPASGITMEDRVNLARFHETPFLVKKPKAGGRFYHPGSSFQRIPSALREKLTINGKKTSEVDIRVATLQFLGIVLKKHTGNTLLNTLLLYEDPYEFFFR